MARFKRSRKQGPVKATKVKVDGIEFSSKLEAFMWTELKRLGVKAKYESEVFELLPPFILPNEVWERKGNSKGDMYMQINSNIRKVTYKPDFIIYDESGAIHTIIETKGRPNEAFPIRWKLFKYIIYKRFPGVIIFKPQKQSECTQTAEKISEYLRQSR